MSAAFPIIVDAMKNQKSGNSTFSIVKINSEEYFIHSFQYALLVVCTYVTKSENFLCEKLDSSFFFQVGKEYIWASPIRPPCP